MDFIKSSNQRQKKNTRRRIYSQQILSLGHLLLQCITNRRYKGKERNKGGGGRKFVFFFLFFFSLFDSGPHSGELLPEPKRLHRRLLGRAPVIPGLRMRFDACRSKPLTWGSEAGCSGGARVGRSGRFGESLCSPSTEP